MDGLWIFVLSLAAGLAATWLSRRLALRLNIVDRPDNTVKTHGRPIAYLGGLGIWVGFAVGMLLRLAGAEKFAGLVWFLAASVLICLVGLADDILSLSPGRKIAGQILTAALAVFFLNPYLKEVFPHLPAPFAAAVSFGLLVFFVLGASNSVNLLDGLDGLCGGVTFLICIGFFLLAAMSRSAFSSFQQTLALSLAAACAGFLMFNYPPASIFMGDAGSLLIGFLLACQMILFLLQGPAAFLASLFIFGLPILDTSVAILRRLLNRKPLFVADRGHIYDQLVDRGFTKTQSVLACYLLTALFSAVGLLGFRLGLRPALPFYLFTILITFFIIWKKDFLRKV
ncbi:MAG TPA: MraY family glycosyltransferase [Anaerohalosphaeraceae bacterium]|nr:MraY family glycosyltransferase [Anaerohalosphaeraceae bacterium]